MFWRLIIILLLCFTSLASDEQRPLKKIGWPFDGFFGKIDRQAAQRGFQVYKEVCSVCHAMSHLSYRNLKNIGFSDEEIKQIAQNYSIADGPNEHGEMFERPRIASDAFANPFANEQAARNANNGAYPLDLSLIIKARADGANYVYSLLTGYEQPPSVFKLGEGLHYNPYFPGKQIAMPAPLSDGMVQYMDGTTASVDQMAQDVVVFLQWAAEPEMEHRKSIGLKTVFFLITFIIVSYLAKKRVWSKLN